MQAMQVKSYLAQLSFNCNSYEDQGTPKQSPSAVVMGVFHAGQQLEHPKSPKIPLETTIAKGGQVPVFSLQWMMNDQ